jgi:hypothetical protein
MLVKSVRRQERTMRTWVGRIALGGIVVLFLGLTPSVAGAATGTVYVRGTVTCPPSDPFVGAWVASSGGKSDFAHKAVYPGTGGQIAKVSLTLASVALPTTVSLNVGCGGSSATWRHVFNGLGKVKASASGTVFINVGCTTASCSVAPRGTAGSTTVNPGADSKQCTYRASAFWKQMTGSFPSWNGDAGAWDNNAPTKRWQVRAWAEPDSLMVWQPWTGNKYGHVGYVADTRVSSGVTQVKIYDRNWDGVGGDRGGVWIGIPSKASFIRVPPRFTTYNR